MSKTIATLGPQGTFSEIATKQYIKQHNIDANIVFYPTLKKALMAVGKDVDESVLPIENFTEGFVNVVLDHLLETDLCIRSESSLPIQFSLVSHCENIEAIKTIYVQFVARGQCAEYLDKLNNVDLIMTESNTQPLIEIASAEHSAAIVPSHLVKEGQYRFVINNVTDYKDNQTRFLCFSKNANLDFSKPSQAYKTSIIVLYHKDYPGYLENVLHEFTMRKINLTSIVSRPTKHTFGKYHFFIDLDGHQQEKNVKEALAAIQQTFNVTILGSYLKC